MKHSFDIIQHMAGVFSNIRDCMPDGYGCTLYVTSIGAAEIWVYHVKTERLIFCNSWEDDDTPETFEDRLEKFMQNFNKTTE